MIDDPIVEEIGRFCKEYAAKYGNNLQRIVEALREKEWLSNRVRLNPGPKQLVEKGFGKEVRR
ncbi:MAG: hypothetical protein D3921_02760 [Candidatus Electrothrix sp. AW1]|nr:hypothetical protein [Candidatus Electrothrix sp. AX1]MCI5181447.1 hypothetical protein [Candidatus Electrothrix gigas]